MKNVPFKQKFKEKAAEIIIGILFGIIGKLTIGFD